MWQHRWALWSGFWGASASCLIKMGVSSDPHSPLQHFETWCQQRPWLADLDQTASRMLYRILGDLMIKYHINLMPYWIALRDFMEERVVPLDMDACRAMTLPARLVCIVGMLVMNTYMIASFLRGMQESGSVVATSLSTAANFCASAFYGAVVWKERMNLQWFAGFGCVLLGVVILSNTAPQSEEEVQSTRQKSKSHQIRKEYARKSSNNGANGTPFSSQQPKSSPKTEPIPRIEKGTVASMKKKFAETSPMSNNDDTPTKTTSTPRININQARKLVKAKREEIKRNSTPAAATTNVTKAPSPPKNKNSKLKAESDLKPYYASAAIQQQYDKRIVDHGFLNECALCDGTIFDTATGQAVDDANVADLSPNTCFHVFHAKCLKQCSKAFGNACPLCQKPLAMWTSAKQAAQFPGFWSHRVEEYLLKCDVPSNGGKAACLAASEIREHFANDPSLTAEQKVFISDDPSGTGKGLQAALEWGGYRDYNSVPKGHSKFFDCLRTKGIWRYDPKKDDVWFWKWGDIHPRQRCAQCQLLKHPLPIECPGCQGSADAAFYCSEACSKRDWQRHKQTCQEWQAHGPA